MNMIERVAKAIDPEAWRELLPNEDYPVERRRRVQAKSNSLALARAAIEAMREPSSGMTKAGVDSCDCWEMSALEVDDCFRMMIDAALKEE